VGSSEAVLLGGLALKRRWTERRKAAGKDTSKPNIVMGTETHVVWEKLTNYCEIEPKWVPNRCAWCASALAGRQLSAPCTRARACQPRSSRWPHTCDVGAARQPCLVLLRPLLNRKGQYMASTQDLIAACDENTIGA
jgi:hypothetical protein